MIWPAVIVFAALFGLVTVLGFLGPYFHRGNLDLLHEWALGGRRFGTLVSWFLIGGDLYTAYTFIAVPGFVYGTGALAFYSLPYTAIAFPLVFVFAPRFWTIAKNRGYITYADFARERYDSRSLSLAVAITGIAATMPYIALQLVGIQVVIKAMGFAGAGLLRDLPIVVAFVILAAYTYRGGLRAPALVAFAKDILIYITVIAAAIVIPAKLGGYGHIFSGAAAALTARPKPTGILLPSEEFSAYITLALGSALAIFMYPHNITGVLSASSPKVIRRNMIALPLYSLLLALLATFGYMAIVAGVHPQTSSDTVPQLFLKMFPAWFAGFAFAAIAIGALVPAAIMSIASANLFTRNIYREFVNPHCTARQESSNAKFVSLLMKLGALIFVLGLPTEYAINFQLFAGGWILQTFPTLIFGMYTRWFHRRALLVGWLAGMAVATYMPATNNFHSVYPLHIGTHVIAGFAAFYAFIVNLVVTVIMTFVFDGLKVARGADKTTPQDYIEAA
ncbi:MAG: sodium:solute symporter family protein [Candidatus Eremiobacteraeota bacterium]|nr:sodium:solute symporter family protein [Candidatus Eremiobacteraeota bacterium]